MIAWVLSPLGRILSGAGVALAFFGWFALDQRQRGAEKAVAKVERNNDKAKQIGRRAAGNNGQPVAGSVRDPGYRIEQ